MPVVGVILITSDPTKPDEGFKHYITNCTEKESGLERLRNGSTPYRPSCVVTLELILFLLDAPKHGFC